METAASRSNKKRCRAAGIRACFRSHVINAAFMNHAPPGPILAAFFYAAARIPAQDPERSPEGQQRPQEHNRGPVTGPFLYAVFL
jgi:hypothetical protein